MSKIIQFKSLGGPEVLEFKDIVLSKKLGSDDALFRGIDYISKKIIEGIFKPKIDKVFSFKSTIEAYKYLLEYDVMGKIVVEIDSK